MIKKMWLLLSCLIVLSSCEGQAVTKDKPVIPDGVVASGFSDSYLNRIRDGFQARTDKILLDEINSEYKDKKIHYDRWGKGLHYSRSYGWGVCKYVMTSFLTGKKVDDANKKLREMCNFYLDNPATMYNRDSFYWSHELYTRIYLFFNTKNPTKVTRLEKESEDILLKMLWKWANKKSSIDNAKDKIATKTWYFNSSENHESMYHTACWGFAKIFKSLDEYSDRKYEDGHTAAEHFEIWNKYQKEYLRERSRRGLFFEVASPGYGIRTLVGIYQLYDLAEDQEMRRLASQLLDLWWACWAQDQIGGIRGGGKARVRGNKSLKGAHHAADFFNIYAANGSLKHNGQEMMVIMTSDYRLPLVVMDIGLDVQGRGVYVTKQRRMGLAVGEHNGPPDSLFRTDFGGILRYTYCTPEFIIGTNMRQARPQSDWHLGASQSTWHGVVLAGPDDALIVPKCGSMKDKYAAKGDTFNEQWSVQSGACMVAQKLKTSKKAYDMRVWFSESGLSVPIERNGWVFVESQGAFVGVRCVGSGISWLEKPKDGKWYGRYTGSWMVCRNEYSPVIIQAARKADFESLDNFVDAVTKLKVEFKANILKLKNLRGDDIVFYADQTKDPKVNGKTVDYRPEMVFDGPFVRSKFESGVVTIQKGNRKKILNFN